MQEQREADLDRGTGDGDAELLETSRGSHGTAGGTQAPCGPAKPVTNIPFKRREKAGSQGISPGSPLGQQRMERENELENGRGHWVDQASVSGWKGCSDPLPGALEEAPVGPEEQEATLNLCSLQQLS